MNPVTDLRGLVPTAKDIRVDQRPPACPVKRAEIAGAAMAAMKARSPDTG